MRTMTSWVKVPGQNTWETRPLPHASWAVSFRPLSNISFAWKEEELKLVWDVKGRQAEKTQPENSSKKIQTEDGCVNVWAPLGTRCASSRVPAKVHCSGACAWRSNPTRHNQLRREVTYWLGIKKNRKKKRLILWCNTESRGHNQEISLREGLLVVSLKFLACPSPAASSFPVAAVPTCEVTQYTEQYPEA